MPFNDNPILVNYGMASELIDLGGLITLCRDLGKALNAPLGNCVVVWECQNFSGSLDELEASSSALFDKEILTFNCVWVKTLKKEATQEQKSKTQAQIDQARTRMNAAAAPQRDTFLKQIETLQKSIDEPQAVSVQITLNVDSVARTVKLTHNQVQLASDVAMGAVGAIETVRQAIPRIEVASAMVARASRLNENISQLETMLPQTSTRIAEIQTVLSVAEKMIDSADNARQQANVSAQEADNVRRQADDVRRKISRLYEEIVAQRDEFTLTLQNATTLAGKYDAEIAKIQERVSILLQVAAEKESDAKNLLVEIGKDLEQIKRESMRVTTGANAAITGSVTKWQNRIVLWDKTFQGLLEEGQRKRDQIHQLLGRAVAANLSTAFKVRQADLEGRRWKWLIGVVLTTAAITGVSYFIVQDAIDRGVNDVAPILVLRAVALIPMLLLDIFLVNQYSRTSSLAEQYAFKASVAASFDYYKEEIVRSSRLGSKIADFVSDTVSRLWSEPSHMTELSSSQVRQFTKTIEKLGVTVLKEGKNLAEIVTAVKEPVKSPPTVGHEEPNRASLN